MNSHKAKTEGWVKTLCHCGAGVFADHFAGDDAELAEGHATRCCNCFDSWVTDGTEDQPWHCEQCSAEGRAA